MTPISVVLGTLLLAIVVSGLFFNIYILFFCTKNNSNQSRTASQVLLLHLGIVNLILAVFFIVVYVPHLFSDAWLEDTTCGFIGPLWDCLHIVALWTVASLNADKYVTIASPLHYARFVSPSKAGTALLVSWLFAAVIVVSIIFIPGISYNMRSSVCILDAFSASDIAGEIHASVTNCFGFIFPILVVAITNGRILIIASHHRHRIVSALWDVTLSAQATVTQQKSHFYLTNYKGRSAATTIFHHVGSLLIMYLPTTACRIYEAVTRLKVSSHLSTSAFILLAVSPTINGFVYGVRNKILRKLLMQVLRKQIYKSEVSCEIQARTPSVSCSRRPSITPSITLPLQKQLTRRMSEIFTPTSTTPSSLNSGETRFKLERQTSDVSSSKGRSSEGSTPRDSTPPTFRTPDTSPLSKFFPKAMIFQRSFDLGSTHGEASTPPPFYTGTQNSLNSTFSFNRQSSLEIMPNGSGYNGGHRQSLRRALFARNKQKSLDLDMVHLKTEAQSLSNCPPRSASHHEMQEKTQQSPSSSRPLLLHGGPLSPGRRSKKVSWSSDSFSKSQDSYHSEIDVNKRWKKKPSPKESELKTNSKHMLERMNSDSRELNSIRDRKSDNNDNNLCKINSNEVTEKSNTDISPKINVFDNPLSNNIPHTKLPKLYSPSEASIIAKIHICH